MLTSGQCIYDTSYEGENGDLRDEAANAGGVIVRASAFRRDQEWWYATQEEAEKAMPEHEAAYRGSSRGPGQLYEITLGIYKEKDLTSVKHL